MSRIDLAGQRFGRLFVVGFANSEGGKASWKCVCDCGNVRIVRTNNLRNGHTQSCGCLAAELSSERRRTHGHSRKAGRVDRLHYIWTSMRQRCLNPRNAAFGHYGGRGIAICAEWDSFEAFRAWALANGYAANLSIDRIDNDGGYEPGNCRWADQTTQVRNRRNSRYLTHEGVTKTISEWAQDVGLARRSLSDRLASGWTVAQALTTPRGQKP